MCKYFGTKNVAHFYRHFDNCLEAQKVVAASCPNVGLQRFSVESETDFSTSFIRTKFGTPISEVSKVARKHYFSHAMQIWHL